MIKHRILIVLIALLSFVVLISCTSDSDESNTINAEVLVFPSETEKRLISEETIPQNNCSGSVEISQSVKREHSIFYSLELGSEIKVSADGKAQIPSIGEVGVGVEVATHYQVGYGREESIGRSITVAAKEGTHIQHTVQQYEIWETGEVLIQAGEARQRLPYSFRRDFAIELLESLDIGCPTSAKTGAETVQQPTDTTEPVEIPAPTPIPDTPRGTILKVGETWIQNDVHLTLRDVEMRSEGGIGRVFLRFDVGNLTGSDLIVSFFAGDLSMVSNIGERFEPHGGNTYASDTATWNKVIENGDRKEVWFWMTNRPSWDGDIFASGFSHLTITVRNWGPISEAVWETK